MNDNIEKALNNALSIYEAFIQDNKNVLYLSDERAEMLDRLEAGVSETREWLEPKLYSNIPAYRKKDCWCGCGEIIDTCIKTGITCDTHKEYLYGSRYRGSYS